MASTAQDDGFHEIQLNGKQLVFLFMAATVVSVVIFLCGVLVGRGVRAERPISAELSRVNDSPLPVSPAPVATPAPVQAGSDPRSAPAPPPVVDDNTYFSRLQGKNPNPAVEALKSSAPPAADAASPAPAAAAASVNVVKAPTQAAKPEPSKSAKPEAAKAPQTSPSPEVASQASRPAAGGYTVQVAAVNARKEADQIVRRLEGKGYPAFVAEPAKGTPAMFRVRIGAFKTRGEAETLAAKLKSKEHFQPWVTR